jgi:hypothetical protein
MPIRENGARVGMVDASEEFLIYDEQTNERSTLRMDGKSIRSIC